MFFARFIFRIVRFVPTLNISTEESSN